MNRNQFPILQQEIYGHPLVYLDNAATTQKPLAVIQAMSHYYETTHATLLRSAHYLANTTYQAVEGVRQQTAKWLNAAGSEEIIFTPGTTAALNLVATAYGRPHLQAGDEVIVSAMEHHSNFLPWYTLCQEKKAILKCAPLTPDGHIDLTALSALLTPNTKIVAISYVSNVLGTINSVREITALAHEQGAIVVVDAAQAAGHLTIDVQALGCDFLAFSCHKMYGPTGLGILYGKQALLNNMPPYQEGGGMVTHVGSTPVYAPIPARFEAGTPNTAAIIGFGAALDFLDQVGMAAIQPHEQHLVHLATQQLSTLPHLQILAPAAEKASLFSFVVQGMHPLDIGLRLNAAGIAVRTGNHCAQPLMDALGLEGTVRVSFALYNTEEEVEQLADILRLCLRTKGTL